MRCCVIEMRWGSMIAPGEGVLAIDRADTPDDVGQVMRSSNDWLVDATA